MLKLYRIYSLRDKQQKIIDKMFFSQSFDACDSERKTSAFAAAN